LAVSQDGGELFVANVWGQSVSEVDLSGRTHKADILFTPPSGGSDKLLDAGKPAETEEERMLSKRAEAALDATAPDAPFPYACVVDSKRRRLYVSLWAQSCVAVVDLKSLQVVARWATEEHPNELALTKSGRSLFVANANRNTVTVIDTSSGHAADAARFLQPDLMGKVTFIQARMYRNTPHGKPQWARPIYPDMTPENIHWQSFVGDSPELAFDPQRFVNWRYFWDYSGGGVFENMSHQLAFWYKTMRLRIPRAVTMTGGIYLWKDGREVPDTMTVAMEHEEELLFTWDSGFGNERLSVTEDVMGTAGTISRTPQTIRYAPEKKNRPDGNEMAGVTRTDPKAHMQNFLDAIRSNREPNCPFDLGYRVSIACRMAVESYRQQRTVRWDPVREEIV
jgi:hypothetical protein